MARTHWFLHSKGGIGKSMLASIFAQYMKKNVSDCHCYDIDASNKTLASFEEILVIYDFILYNAMKLSISSYISQAKAYETKKYT